MKKPSIFYITSLYKKTLEKTYVFLRYVLLPFKDIEPFIPKKGKIVSLGCGFGLYEIYFALCEKKRNIIGYELNKKRVLAAIKASKDIKNAEFKQKDFNKDKSLSDCDSIIGIDILHHIPRETQKDLIKECHKKLKKGGLLIIKDINSKPKIKYIYNYIHDKIMTLNDDLFYTDPKELKKIIEKIGFDVKYEKVKTWFFNPIPHVIYICKKK